MEIIMLLVSAFSGYCAYSCFKEGNDFWGWANLIMSSWNFANLMTRVF